LPHRFNFFLFRFFKYAFALLLLGWVAHTYWFYSLPRKDLAIGPHTLRVAIADTVRSQTWGLMFRFSLSDGEGMLFVFPQPQKVYMWMKYTFIPLSVAFLRKDGVVTRLDDMAPMTRDQHCSNEPVGYVLEVPQGWYAAHGVNPGDEITGLPKSVPNSTGLPYTPSSRP
jgi:hypothetical protein